MTKILQLLSALCLCTFLSAQSISFDEAPLNPKPLEKLGFVLPSTLKGDVAYYAGNFYDKDRNRLLEDGSTFMAYAAWDKDAAKSAKGFFLAFDDKGRILEVVKYTDYSPITHAYEYNDKGQLVKYSYLKDMTTYTYDKKGRLETEFRTFSSTDRTVTLKYDYKIEKDLLKITIKSIYVDGEEVEEQHFKNGRKVYGKTSLGEEYTCEPDKNGNCVNKKRLKNNAIEKVFYNVVYRDEINADHIILCNKKEYSYQTNVPQIVIRDCTIKLPVVSLGKDAIVYLPMTGQYLLAKNFYDSSVAINDSVSTTLLQFEGPYLAMWKNENTIDVIKGGSRENLVIFNDDHYMFCYDATKGQYLYCTKEGKSTPGQIIPLKVLDTELVMYMDMQKKEGVTIIKGQKLTYMYSWTVKPLNDKEVIMYYKSEPTYIVPNVAAPEHLKLYTARNYNGENPAGS